jgi:hypothetical protein
MKNILIIFSLFLSIQFATAQKQDCGWFGTMKPAERMKQFPFDTAKRIVLISFPSEIDFYVMKQKSTSSAKFIRTEKVTLTKYPHEYNILQEKELTALADIDKLSNILINYKVRKGYPRDVVSVTGCYEPRNGILFYDENNVLVCFIEICFECKAAFIAPDDENINFLNYVDAECSERIDLLHDIFVANGIN